MPPKKADEEQLNVILAPVELPYMDNVLPAFVNSIPVATHASCKLENGTKYPAGDANANQQHLASFVRERLATLARREYVQWINGQLPFISPRELRLWRLSQFAQHIWGWQLPDDDDLAMIFNLTKRQANNLAADFSARFRKTALFPTAIRRVYAILRDKPVLKDVELRRAIGNVFKIPSRRYIDDTNALINELDLRKPDRTVLRPAVRHEQNDQFMWVNDGVLKLITDDKIRDLIFSLYPLPK